MLKNALFEHILNKNYVKQRLIVIFSILLPLFHKLCVLVLPPLPPWRHFFHTIQHMLSTLGGGRV